MQILRYLIGFIVALAVFFISAMLLAVFIPDPGSARGPVIIVAGLRLVLALGIAILAFRGVTKQRPPRDGDSQQPPAPNA